MADPSRGELKYFVERQREEIKTLNEVGKLLSSTTDPDEIVRLTTSYFHRAFPVALCGILFLPQKQLRIVPFAPISELELANAIRLMRDRASEVFNRSVTEQDSACPMPTAAPAASWQPTTPLRSSWFCPMTDKGRPIGLVGLFSGQAEAFTKEDHHAVGIVAEQLTAALRNAYLVEELRKADELKNQLLSIVSHELSTPLTAIKEGVNLVLDGSLGATTSEQRDFLGTVAENAERLERIIQKIKTSTELMTGQTKFAFKSTDLRTILAHVEKTHQVLAKGKGVHVTLMSYPKPLFWPVDQAHLTIALSQIVENAIQATPSDGLVTLKLMASATEAQIQIADTGSGMPKEMLPRLFERFQSIGDINNRKMGGLGLGMSITKALIEGHHGTIEVTSQLGEGTHMTVTLPKPAETV